MLPSLPSKAYRQSKDDIDIPLSALDPETSRLIPTKKHAHRAWIQGRLAPVRVASTTSLRNAPPKYSDVFASPSQCDHDNGGLRRRSLDDGGASGGAANGDGLDDDESDGADKEVRYQARQLRGYGIGGAGNIRRPTDVIHGPTRGPWYSPSASDPETPTTDKHKWSLRELLARRADRKGKARAASNPSTAT